MGIRYGVPWLVDRVRDLMESADGLHESIKARDNIGMHVSASDIARHARAIVRCAESMDVFADD